MNNQATRQKKPRGTVEERFWAKVNKLGRDECWEWQANLGKDGYGLFTVRVDRHARAHRLSWELAHGEIPAGLFVLHRCDNPPCVNPAHLFLGDHKANMRDMVAKRRAPAHQHPHIYRTLCRNNAKLTAEQVAEIRNRLAAGERQASIAMDYPVGATMISRIACGHAWVAA